MRGFARISRVTKSHAIGAVAAAAATALGLASAAYQAAGEAQDRRRHPPPGLLVDVGGYRLHIECTGEGAPPVVICPALGATTEAWREVQRTVAAETSVCVYDRAGLGYSDSPRKHRTAVRMAAELHTLLHAADIAPPYILAGHSMGGLIARVFIALYPAEVAGLALVDSSHPEMKKRTAKTDSWQYPGGALFSAVLDRTRPLGARRIAHDLGIRKEDRVPWSSNRCADQAEFLAISAICEETAEVAGNLGDLPLAVVTSAKDDPNDEPGSRHEQARSRFYPDWVVLQNELAALSTNSTHVVAKSGGHHLNRDNPELVAEVITDLVKRVRSAL